MSNGEQMAGDAVRAAAAEAGRNDESVTISAADALGALPGNEWRIFHDLRWPGRPQARIDHVAVGPQGVFVIETAEWSEDVDVVDGVLHHGGRRRTRLVRDAENASETVGALLPEEPGETVLPVLCFVGPEPVFGWAGEALVCSTENLCRMLTSRPRLLDEGAVDEAGRALGLALQSSTHSPVRRPGPSSRRRGRRRVSSEGLAGRMVLAGICVVLVWTCLRLDVLSTVAERSSEAISELRTPTEPIGSSVTVHQTPARPALEVTVDRPVRARSTTANVRPAPGAELVSVEMTLRNAGGERWTSFPGTEVVLRDEDGRTHQHNPLVRSIRQGRVLPSSIGLPPGRTTRGYVVFEVPAGVKISTVELTVGPGKPETTRWRIR